MEVFSFIDKELAGLTEAGLERTFRLVDGAQGPRVSMGGREVLLFCSNDYLGLADDPEVKAAAVEATQRYGTGAGASRLVSGNMPLHRELEERVREFKKSESALLFNSGYNANLGVITSLADRDTEIFSDRYNHASLIDAALLSRARVRRYSNRDVGSLEGLVKKSRARKKLIVTDGVFSMDGTIAPLRDIAGLAERYGAMVYLDDAHAAGVLGPGGRGTLEHLGVESPNIIEMGTLGKAFGSFGAFVTGPEKVIRLLISRARPFVFTTALPPAVCAASIKAMEKASIDPSLRGRVSSNAALLRDGLRDGGLDILGSVTHIVPVLAGGPEKTMETSTRLLSKGIYIQGIRPPTVPAGTSRLRVTVTAKHTEEDIKAVVSAIRESFQETGATKRAGA